VGKGKLFKNFTNKKTIHIISIFFTNKKILNQGGD
jgi:hypothetical protein